MMRLVSTAALALCLPLMAQAQSPADNDLVKAVTLQDMKDLATREGHKVGEPLQSGVGISAEDTDGLKYIIRGAACSDADACVGLEVMVLYFGAHDPDFANTINQRYSAIKATSTDGTLLLSRYLILDEGQSRGNLRINLRNTLAIASQVQNGADFQSTASDSMGPGASPAPVAKAGLNFGDDTGDYANDGSCDDARFIVDGDDWTYQRAHALRDASDCEKLYSEGSLTLYFDFGTNSGEYRDDGTCDDSRFTGSGRSILQTDSHVLRDADDCINAYRAGTIERP